MVIALRDFFQVLIGFVFEEFAGALLERRSREGAE
jgi:hypothetical protein